MRERGGKGEGGQEPFGIPRARWRRVQNPKAVIELFCLEPTPPIQGTVLSISILDAKPEYIEIELERKRVGEALLDRLNIY